VAAARRAHIVGCGFAGLTAATLLARAGWDVLALEQADAVREIGAGLFITHNGLLVLEELGVLGSLRRRGVQLEAARYLNGEGRRLAERELRGAERTWLFPRPALIDELHRAAIAAGARIQTGCRVTHATPDGRLRCADGSELAADLVVAADGFHSTVRRECVRARARSLGTTSIRLLIGDRSLAPEAVTEQYWHGRRRLAITPCSPSETYVYLACPEGDPAGSGPMLACDLWSASFPALAGALRLLGRERPHIAPYVQVNCRTWQAGRIALLGDAAHAMAPTLGQGTNLAMVNARSLVTFLGAPGAGVEQAIARWERAVRPMTASAQRWSSFYDQLTRRWPPALGRLREPVIRRMTASSVVARRMRAACQAPPLTEARLGPEVPA